MGLKKKLKKIKSSLGCAFGTSKRRKGSHTEEDANHNQEHPLSPRLSCIARDEEMVAYIEDEPSIEVSPDTPVIQSKPSSIAFDRNRSQTTRSNHHTKSSGQIQGQEQRPKDTTNTYGNKAHALSPPPMLSPASSSYSYISNVTEPSSVIKVRPSTEEKSRHIRTGSSNNGIALMAAQQEEPFQFGSYNKLLSPASDAVTLDDEIDPLRLETPSNGVMSGFFALTSPLSLVFGSRSDSQQFKGDATDDKKTSPVDQIIDAEQDTKGIGTTNLELKESVVDAPSDEHTLPPPAPTPTEENGENIKPLPKQNCRAKSLKSLYGSAKSSSNMMETEQEAQSQSNDKAQQQNASSPSDPKEKKKRKLFKKLSSSGSSPLQSKDTNASSLTTSGKGVAPKRDAPLPDEIEEVKKLKLDEAPELESEEEIVKTKTVRHDAWKDYKGESVSFGDTCIMGTHGQDPLTAPRVLSPPLMESLQMFLPFACSEDHLWLKYSLVRDGASLETMLSNIQGSTRTIVAIETTQGEVFGSFTSETWSVQPNFFGNGEAFLWRLKEPRLVEVPASSCSEEKQATLRSKLLKLDSDVEVYPYSQLNTYVQKCTQDEWIVGGGPWHEHEGGSDCPFEDETKGVGLTVDQNLEHGSTGTCATFANRALSKLSPLKFDILNLEVWTLTPFYPESQAKAAEDRKIFIDRNTPTKARGY